LKKLYPLLSAILLSTVVFAQSPNKMSYQSVVRDAADNLVVNGTIGMQISILQGSTTGVSVYTETQTPTSNANGLVSIEIGGGTSAGDFSTIDWSTGPYFVMTEIDLVGGTNYTITGTSQLLSVPYALHASVADSIAGGLVEVDGDTTNEIQTLSLSGSDLTISGGNTISLPTSSAMDIDTITTGLTIASSPSGSDIFCSISYTSTLRDMTYDQNVMVYINGTFYQTIIGDGLFFNGQNIAGTLIEYRAFLETTEGLKYYTVSYTVP
jgi:hypothetical protein